MIPSLYTKEYVVGWGDLDANSHMKNTAYLDYAHTTRFSFFHENGFSGRRFHEISLGPVVFKDEIQYFKELYLLDRFRVTLELDGISSDGRIFRLMNEIVTPKGERAAVVTSHGAWFDLKQRKVTAPPPDLSQAVEKLARTQGFQEIVRSANS